VLPKVSKASAAIVIVSGSFKGCSVKHFSDVNDALIAHLQNKLGCYITEGF
jgi:hypothetical protein